METEVSETNQIIKSNFLASEKDQKLIEISLRISNCTKCSLACTRLNTIPGQGNSNTEIIFLGEAGGEEEDKTGQAFVGRSGKLLTKMIEAMGLTREQVFICNILKCRPPNNRTPTSEEIETCLPYLVEQLNVIKPKLIVALGKTAAIGLGILKPTDALGPARGKIHSWEGIPVIVTYHPSYLLRNQEAKALSWLDLQMSFPYLSNRKF